MRSRKPSRGPKSTIQPRTHPQNTHETLTRARDHHLKTLTDSQRSHIIGQRSHCANFSSRWPPGRTDDGRTDDDPQIRAPSPSHWRIVSRSQLRSLARTHATQTQAQSKSISRFGGRTKACTTPPTSNIHTYMHAYIHTYIHNLSIYLSIDQSI